MQSQQAPGSGQQSAANNNGNAFLRSLFDFMSKRGTPIREMPQIEGRQLNLISLYAMILRLGGSQKIAETGQWGQVAQGLGFVEGHGGAMELAFKTYLLPYEVFVRQRQQQLAQMQSQLQTQTQAQSPGNTNGGGGGSSGGVVSNIAAPSPPSRPGTPGTATSGISSIRDRTARPSLTGGSGGPHPLLATAPATRPPHYEVDNPNRVLGKRKLQELVQQIDPHERLDPHVEDFLLDVADEFIDSVITFACRLAKHRKSTTLDVKDVQLHLERNWGIRVPGYAPDEVRPVKKHIPTHAYQQKLNAIAQTKVEH